MSSVPIPSGNWKRLNSRNRSKLKHARSQWRKKHQRKKYLRLQSWVKAIRIKLRMSQQMFAESIGVSRSAVKRWENASGFLPSGRNRQQLVKLSTQLGIREEK